MSPLDLGAYPNEVVIYGKPECPFCDKAKMFFEEMNIPFRYVGLDPSDTDYEDMKTVLKTSTKQNTFPFIFIGKEFLGGFTELIRAHRTLQLHSMCEKIGIKIDYDF